MYDGYPVHINGNEKKKKTEYRIRLKRNLVHPVKFVVENPTVNRDTCLQVLREMQSILISRGFENGFTIPAN